MQLVNFDNRCESIEKNFSQTHLALRYEKSFKPKLEKDFNFFLNNLFSLLLEDRWSGDCAHNNPLWHTAYRIVRLSKLSQKIEKILVNIHLLPGANFFSNKVTHETLPALAQRIHHLNMCALLTHRLPFSPRNSRETFFKRQKEVINFVNSENLMEAERDFFHLMGNHLRLKNEKEISLPIYSGSCVLNSLLSWGNILKLTVQQESHEADREKFKFLLNVIKEVIPTATKLNYISSFDLKKIKNNLPDYTYYEFLLSCVSDKNLKLPLPKLNVDDFNCKYNLDQFYEVPLKIMENDITWDIVQAISNMEKNDVKIYLLGSALHTVAIQITCTENDFFKYEIFNTGQGVHHHRLHEQSFSRPMIYHNVPKYALDYLFFSILISQMLCGKDMDFFYYIHDSYFISAEAIKDLDGGEWYATQKFGTCTYSSLEACINSHLNSSQREKLEWIKTMRSTERQSAVVYWLNKGLTEGEINSSGTNRSASNMMLTKDQKLKESLLLLDAGERHLFELNRES